MNKLIIIGRLGRDPEMRYTQGGKAVCNFSVAVDGPKRDNDTTWFRVTTWERLAETCNEFLKKGSLVGVEGRVEERTFEKDGQPQKTWGVTAQHVEFLGGRRDDEGQSPREAPRQNPPQQRRQQPSGRQVAEDTFGGGRGDYDDPPF